MGRGGLLGSNSSARCLLQSRPYSSSSSSSSSRLYTANSSRSIRALIIGSPGSGKGTLSTRLLKVIPSLEYISAGDVLRHEISKETEIGKQADKVIRSGNLMPDEIMMRMMSGKVVQLGTDSSWLLDGFPRTSGQAVMFDRALEQREQDLNLVLHLDVPNEVVMSRILDRWIHEPSGRTYNMRFNPPKVEGKDDITGEELVKRSDDDAVRQGGFLCIKLALPIVSLTRLFLFFYHRRRSRRDSSPFRNPLSR
jgi:nucleoside-triphosphate--adenylate kinase